MSVPDKLASVEQVVTKIWCEVLDVPTCEPDENFITSGGDSVQLLELLARVRDQFGVELSLVTFLKEPTIASVIELVESER